MSPAHVVEPTYEAIKRRLMRGDWRPGARLESARLADELGVSVTPVRDSLYRLAGERMVDFAHGEGFRVHRLTETEFRDMLELNLILILSAIGFGEPGTRVFAEIDVQYPDRLAILFLNTAHRSGNLALAAAVGSLNDRLHLARRLDARVLGEIETEMGALEGALTVKHEASKVRTLVMRHHERRALEAHIYARLLADPDI